MTEINQNVAQNVAAESTMYGYCRVSTREQNLDRQILAMTDFGVKEKDIFTEKMSGKDFERPVYMRLVKTLREGDILVIKSIDRLGRSYRSIQDEWRHITKEIGAHVVVLDMPLLDTRQDQSLMGMMIADLVLQILSYVAETERAFLLQRQREGIDAAVARGIRFGAEKKPIPETFDAVYQLWYDGEVSAHEAARLIGCSYSTFRSWIREKQGVDRYSGTVEKRRRVLLNGEKERETSHVRWVE